jgi:hypothetical protein
MQAYHHNEQLREIKVDYYQTQFASLFEAVRSHGDDFRLNSKTEFLKA